jgi:hypothetical protein
MFKTVWRDALRVGAVLALVVSGFSAPAQQFSGDLVRFSGDLVRTDAGGTTPRLAGKLKVLRDKVRMETPDVPSGFFLVLGEIDAAYFVMPAQRIFMDAKQSSQLTQVFVVVEPDDPCTRWRAMAKLAGPANESTEWRCQRINDETINARRAVKYLVISPVNRRYFGWIDRQLRFPVRLQYEDGAVLDLVNIQEAPQPESLFILPPGYRKFDPQLLINRIKQSDVWVEPAH